MKCRYHFILAFFLSACTANHYSSQPPEKPIKLAQFYCAKSQSLSGNKTLDSDYLYSQMRSCLMKKEYASAAVLFSLSGSLSWYQAANSRSEALRTKHITLLKNNLKGLPAENLHQFWPEVHKILGTPEQLNRLCSQFMTLEPQIDKKDPAFESVRWHDALENYLHCPMDSSS